MLLTVQPQRHPPALPARDVIPPELLPISENSAIGHQSLHCFPVFRKTRPPQTGRKDVFVAGLRCKWQGPFAPRTLLRFIAPTDPAATLSSSADFPVSPVIRPTLLRRFLAGMRRASPVAQHVLVTVLSLPPRQGEQPRRSDFGCSCCLRPTVAGSALGDSHFRGHNAFTFVPAR